MAFPPGSWAREPPRLYNFGLYAEGSQELSIQRCRDWCYSSLSCLGACDSLVLAYF